MYKSALKRRWWPSVKLLKILIKIVAAEICARFGVEGNPVPSYSWPTPPNPPKSPIRLHCYAAVASCMLHVLQVLQDGRQRLFNMPVPPFPHLALTLASQRNDRRRCKVLKSARHNLHIKGKWKKTPKVLHPQPTYLKFFSSFWQLLE